MSGILGAYQDSTDKALDVMGARPLEAETPKPKHSAWSVVPRAVGAAAAEVGGNLIDIMGAYGQTAAIQYAGNPLVGEKAQQQARDAYDRLTTEGIDWRSPASKPAYEFSRDLRPDPLTAGTAEQMVFSIGKGLTKAIGSALLLGPVGGATTFGVSEGMTTAEDLAEQGVDKSTRTKVGLVTGAVSAGSVALPVAGQTLKQTVGLVAVGGPLSFMGQQQATRSILENADYAEIAAQYDPLDPVGLAVATLLPAGFAAYAKRGGFNPVAKPDATPTTETPGAVIETAQPTGPARPTPEQMDAVMVHNLTAARDAHEDVPAQKVAAEMWRGPVTENPNFKAWFGESKVAGDDGKPLVVSHYTDADIIETFDSSFLGSNTEGNTDQPQASKMARLGFWFSDSDVRYTKERGRGMFANNKIDVYLSIRSPKEYESFDEMWADSDSYKSADDWRAALESDGNDGIVVRDDTELGGTSYVSFYPTQIKSAIGNSGKFDPESPSLTDPIDASAKPTEAPQDQATPSRAEAIKTETPDLPVEVTDDGTHITAAQKLDDARKLAQEGTDTELGALDAPLLKVAAECFLSQ